MRQLFNIFILFFLFSCSKNVENMDVESKSNNTQEPLENLNIQTKNFIEVDSTGILMFPLEMGENKRDGNYSYKEMPENGYWNILFLNSNNNEYHLLTEKKILILDYSYKYGREEGVNIARETNHIFYNARTSDFNKDKIFDEKDPVYLFVSGKFGKNFRQISPDNYSVNYWKFIQNNSKIILTATKDSNKNNIFDDKDEVTTFELILDKQETPKEVFKSEIKQKIKKLYDRDWKRIEK